MLLRLLMRITLGQAFENYADNKYYDDNEHNLCACFSHISSVFQARSITGGFKFD